MSRFGKWLSRGTSSLTSSRESLNLTAEAQNMDVALRATEKIMNDDIVGAEAALAGGDSAFHKLAKGTLSFMKATLGFEQDAMKEATDLLYEAENAAYTYYYKAQHDSSAFHSQIYDKGTEFLLCQAQAQIMSAIVGVLNESLIESMKGFYKMRKAYMTLEQIIAMEQNYVKARDVKSLSGSRIGSRESLRSFESSRSGLPTIAEPQHAQTHANKPSALRNQANPFDSDEEFYDGNDGSSHHKSNGYAMAGGFDQDTIDEKMAHLDIKNGTDRRPSSTRSVSAAGSLAPGRPNFSRTTTGGSKFGIIEVEADDEIFKSSIDVFIHSGTNLMFGIISLMISVIPPAFGKVLSIIGFRGDRERGMRLLWQASKFSNINGGMAALVLFGWYNGLIGFCDIYSDPDPEIPFMEQVEGYPDGRLRALLEVMRARYPQSHLWKLEEARMAAANRDCTRALKMLNETDSSDIKQLQALKMFEKALNAQNSHKYELCAEYYLECIELNAWSQALYYYIAASAHLQLARDMAIAHGDLSQIKAHEAEAEKLFLKAPTVVGKKKMMGRQLPFDTFVVRKINKWKTNSAAWHCTLIEAIGVSPIEEMIYLWNGYKKMDEKSLLKSMDNLVESEESVARYGQDEKAVLALLKANVYRNLRQHEKAQAILERDVFVHDKAAFSGPGMDTWAAPSSYYEHAVNSWQMRNEYVTRFGKTLAGPSANREEATPEEIKADGPLVASAKRHIEVAKNWGSYELDARIGMKLTAGLGAVSKWERKNGIAA